MWILVKNDVAINFILAVVFAPLFLCSVHCSAIVMVIGVSVVFERVCVDCCMTHAQRCKRANVDDYHCGHQFILHIIHTTPITFQPTF